MKIATWNIGSLYAGYQENNKELKRQVEDLNADVFCMQEFPDDPHLINEILKYGAFTDYYFYVTSPSHIGPAHDMGVILFAKGQLTHRNHIMLIPPDIDAVYNGKKEPIHSKAVLSAKCFYGQTSFTLITGHGFPLHRYGLDERHDLFETEFIPLEEYLSTIVHSLDTERIIVGGDFNCGNILRYSKTLRDYFYDAFFQIPTRPSGRKTDAILLQNDALVKEKFVRCVQGFDHFLLYLDAF